MNPTTPETEMSTESLFPCWGRHQRMGHTVLLGHFTAGPGDTAICTVPEIPETDTHTSHTGSKHVVPMSGPAFFGFDLLDEESVLKFLRRRYCWEKPQEVPQLPMHDDIEEAEEVACDLEDHTESDSDDDIPW